MKNDLMTKETPLFVEVQLSNPEDMEVVIDCGGCVGCASCAI